MAPGECELVSGLELAPTYLLNRSVQQGWGAVGTTAYVVSLPWGRAWGGGTNAPPWEGNTVQAAAGGGNGCFFALLIGEVN